MILLLITPERTRSHGHTLNTGNVGGCSFWLGNYFPAKTLYYGKGTLTTAGSKISVFP